MIACANWMSEMSEVVPFPLTRRQALIQRHAERIVASSTATGEKLLTHLLRQQAQALRRKGIPENVVERECRSLECAIRAELWRVVLQPEGAA